MPPGIQATAERKLDSLNAAHDLRDLAIPPGNRLEPLRGEKKGFHSIRIYEQWRVVFLWKDGDAYEVCIEDYH
jgi:proteic killer suppression protein